MAVEVTAGRDNFFTWQDQPVRSLSFSPKGEMVGAVGFEPTFSAIFKVSLMLIFAFLCANLHTKLRDFTSYFKDYFASLCIANGRKVLAVPRIDSPGGIFPSCLRPF
jgi:hypothetical protein